MVNDRRKAAARILMAIVCLVASTFAFADNQPAVFFRMEFTKSDIYTGEQVLANFMIYSKEDVLDVEVAKFPEFRGYWSENLSLRQGPIPLALGLGNGDYKKALVGSYVLTSMIGKEDPSIVPMKIVVRDANPSQSNALPERSLYSEAISLVIHPLPPLPKTFEARFFNGAIGRFTLTPDARMIPFQKDEPISVRFVMQGEGNFPEVNVLEIPFPPQVEVLSRKSLTQGSGQYSSKTFELSLAVHSDQGFALPENPFIYFDPMLRQYEQILLPSMQFEFLPPGPKEKEADREPVFLPPPEKEWTVYRPITRRFGFIALQVLVGLSLLGASLKRLASIAAKKRRQSPAFLRSVKVQLALEQYNAGNIESFLRQASDLTVEILHERAKPAKPMNKSQLLAVLQAKGQTEAATQARSLFEALDLMAYSPAKINPSNPETLLKSLEDLLGKSLSPHAA